MADPFNADDPLRETYFINESERDSGTPTNDNGKIPQNEADGRLSPYFTRNGAVLNCGETLNGATTPVPVFQNKTDNELYACDGNDLTKLKFVGFVTTNGTDGNPARFQGSGVVSGFSGLDEGEKYYVQDAVGTIGTTPGTYEVLVGVAISPTQLLIQKGTRRAAGNGSSLGTASSSLAVTTGFRPSVIRIKARAITDGGANSYLDAVWVNNTMTGVSTFNEATADNLAIANARLYSQNASNYMEFTITSVTDSGFTITWTESGTFAPDDSMFHWEAEGHH